MPDHARWCSLRCKLPARSLVPPVPHWSSLNSFAAPQHAGCGTSPNPGQAAASSDHRITTFPWQSRPDSCTYGLWDPATCRQDLLSALVVRLQDVRQPPMLRATCAAYAASFLAWAKSIPNGLVVQALQVSQSPRAVCLSRDEKRSGRHIELRSGVRIESGVGVGVVVGNKLGRVEGRCWCIDQA